MQKMSFWVSDLIVPQEQKEGSCTPERWGRSHSFKDKLIQAKAGWKTEE